LAIVVLSAGVASVAHAQTAKLPATALKQINELLAEKENRTPAQRKISSGLLYTTKAKLGARVTANVKALEVSVPLRDDGRVDVDITGTVTKAVLESLERVGAEVVNPQLGAGVVRAAVPLEALEDIASLNEVRTIHPAMRAMTQTQLSQRRNELLRTKLLSAIEKQRVLPSINPVAPVAQQSGGVVNTGSVNSEGSRAHGAERARTFFGVTGAGVRIGVLSDSDDFKEASIATGDLPADTVTVPGESGRPGSGEGTAMLQIVHDVAPGSKLFFATAFTSPESFADNIRTLRFVYHCDIIVDDVIYFFESPYQDDIIARAVIDVINDGALYFSSAGNEGNLNDGTGSVWEGDFKQAAAPLAALPAGYEVHNFGAGVISDRIELAGGPLVLHWSDEAALDNAHSSNDYDLFVLSADLSTVAVASTDIQDGDDIPFEFLGFFIPANFQVVIARKIGAETRAVRIQLFGGELALATDGATYGHAVVQDAYGVAAVDAALAGTGEFTGGPTNPIELFSSDGPRRMFFQADGEKYNSFLTFKNGGGITRQKPDLTGADGVHTTLPSNSGLNPFFGTSAAAPHAAAIAGLVKSAKPLATQARIRTALTRTAFDIEAVGRDRDSGFGIVNAFGALQNIGATPMPFLELGTVTAAPATGDGDAFIEPGESATVSTQLLNIGGATATNLVGVLSTSTPGVTVTSGASPFPNIPAGGSSTNTIPYRFSLAPTATCGVATQFSLNALYGSPTLTKTFSFKVATGQPSATPTNISFAGPRVAIPDNNAAGVNIPIPVVLGSAVSKVVFSIDGTSCSSAIGSTTVGLDHTWVGDLVVTLTSPSGTTVTLMQNPGGSGNSGNNFCQTVLDDAAVNLIQNIAIAGAPWTGSFKPAQPLAAFVGENATGTWTLNVSDRAALDTGGVRAFTLAISGYTCTP
jgi:subtilisin-like proprotein convertase family protein